MRDASRREVLGRIALGSVVAAAVAGCSERAVRSTGAPRPSAPLASTPGAASSLPASPSPSASAARRVVDVGPLPPNELGVVPVLMFHRVSDPVLGEYDITPDALWDMLVRLHAEGYRPIRLVDLVRRRIDVPRGRTPVVLTFDDSSPGQFHRFASGGIDPRSGVGLLRAFSAKHPEFAATATLFLNAHPFADAQTGLALRTLVRDGFELGNHTFDHVNLGQVTAVDGQREILALQNLVTASVRGVRPVSFSLPYGVWPADRGITVSGGVGAASYRHEAVVLVGADPAPSPYSAAWDPAAIPRIRASSWEGGQQPFCASWWLDRLARDPGQRYVASGHAGTVTFPRTLSGNLRPELSRRARPYTV